MAISLPTSRTRSTTNAAPPVSRVSSCQSLGSGCCCMTKSIFLIHKLIFLIDQVKALKFDPNAAPSRRGPVGSTCKASVGRYRHSAFEEALHVQGVGGGRHGVGGDIGLGADKRHRRTAGGLG